MDKLREAAREVVRQHSMECLSDKTVDALREALAEQERKAKYDERFERLEKFEQQAEQSQLADASLETDGLEKALRAILPPVFPFEQMFSTQGEVKMSNNNMREIGHAFINHACEFQFVPCAAENMPVNAIMVYTTEDDFQKACAIARELAEKFSTINDSKSFRDGYELGKQAVINEDGK